MMRSWAVGLMVLALARCGTGDALVSSVDIVAGEDANDATGSTDALPDAASDAPDAATDDTPEEEDGAGDADVAVGEDVSLDDVDATDGEEPADVDGSDIVDVDELDGTSTTDVADDETTTGDADAPDDTEASPDASDGDDVPVVEDVAPDEDVAAVDDVVDEDLTSVDDVAVADDIATIEEVSIDDATAPDEDVPVIDDVLIEDDVLPPDDTVIDEDAPPVDDVVEPPSPLVLGRLVGPFGNQTFVPLSPGDTVEIVQGPQGGIHAEAALQMTDPDLLDKLTVKAYCSTVIDGNTVGSVTISKYTLYAITPGLLQSATIPITFQSANAILYANYTATLSCTLTVGDSVAASVDVLLVDEF